MTSLYQLSNEHQKLLSKDEFDDADMVALHEQHGFLEDKIINCACILNELKAKKESTEKAIQIAKNKSNRIESNIQKLENYVLKALTDNHIEKIDKHPLFDIKVQTNRASVDDYEPTEIPEEYFKQKVTLSLDKVRVKEDIEKLGLVIPGVRLIKKVILKIE